jgi:beta-lactam-binding protein with PASTA domain
MKWMKAFLYFAAGVVVFVTATSITIGYLLRDDSTVTCPDVTGLDVEDARSVAAHKGLSLVITKYEKKKDVPYNLVMAQVPDPSIPVRSGRTLSVIVSDGPRATEIASYVGLSLEEAQAALREKGIGVKKIIYVPNEAVGKVLAQIPASGRNILDDEGMSLVVGGREKRFFVMPDIASEDYTAAAEEMDKKEINYTVGTGGPFGFLRKEAPTSVPPKTVFGDDQVLEIRANAGG